MSARAKSKPTWPKGAWTPRRRGDVYCSPACGGNCTFKAFNSATFKASLLCEKLGAGWEPDVWENLGWHHAVISPCRRIRLSGGYGQYIAFLTEKGESGGRYVADGRTPKSAIRACVAEAKADLAKIGATITGLPFQ